METKIRDVVALYLNPPENAVVLCVDEKSRFQALDRTADAADPPRAARAPNHDYRLTLHFTPTSGSWLNTVEIFFGIITLQAIRRGTFASERELTDAILEKSSRKNTSNTRR